jgi:hypothetical protein
VRERGWGRILEKRVKMLGSASESTRESASSESDWEGVRESGWERIIGNRIKMRERARASACENA